MDVQALRIRQDGTTLYVTALPAAELTSRSKPDLFRVDEGSDRGYQRTPERTRALQIAQFLKQKQVLLPTAIILGARSPLPFNDETGMLTLPDGADFFEVDGQHRTAGFRVAIHEMGFQRLSDFPLVTVIIDATTEDVEAEQFRVINETAKKVRTDLARRLLAKVARLAPLSAKRQAVAGRKWEIKVTKVIELLQADPQSPWYGRIQMPYQKKGPQHTIKEKSFGDSLRPLLTTFPYDDMAEDAIAQGINDYWSSWITLMRMAPDANEYGDPFEEPHEFILLKAAPGVISQHLVLRHLWKSFERRPEPFESPAITQALRAAGDEARKYDDDFTTRRSWHREESPFAFFGGQKGSKAAADLMIYYLNDAGYTLE